MRELIFEMIENLLDMSAFELEYQHRAKTNPFSEKWLNCTRTRYRIKALRHFLYHKIKVILSSNFNRDFFEIALKSYMHVSFEELVTSFEETEQVEEMDLLYRSIYYRFSLDELFILFTNLLSWEHMKYPYILETALANKREYQDDPLDQFDSAFRYYVRFLDVLSSQEIVSLFDLDALKHTITQDYKLMNQGQPVEEMNLFRDWPEINPNEFNDRFPEFKDNLSKRLIASQNMQ